MWDILKKIYCYIFGFGITKDIQVFINENKKYWSDFSGSRTNGFVLLPPKNSATNFVSTSRTAKSIEEKTGCLPLVFVDAFSFSSKLQKNVYRSFNINNFIYFRNYLYNIFNILKASCLAIKFYINQKNINDLLELKCDNIYIGDLIYDTILRKTPNLFTIDKFKFSYIRYVFYAYLYTIIYSRVFDKYKIKYVCSGLLVFIKWGILARVADANDAIVLVIKKNLLKNYQGLDIREGQYYPRKSDVEALKMSKNVYHDVDKYLENRFSGNIKEVDASRSYKGKCLYDKDELVKKLGIDKNKPIVFIMAHAFSDGPHHTPIERFLFKDFYVWLNETIKFISEIDSVNWIIKPHPMSPKYHEEGAVEKMVNAYKSKNIYLAPNDLSTQSIKNVAHSIVTANGKVALEFGCFGIPTIVAAHASYCGFGVVVEPRTKKEYFETLRNIKSISKLNNDQIETMKVLTAIMFIYSRTKDPLFPWDQNFFNPKSEESKWKELSVLIKEYDRSKDEFYQRIKDLLDNNLYKKYLN